MDGLATLKEHSEIIMSLLAVLLYGFMKKYADTQEKRLSDLEDELEALGKRLHSEHETTARDVQLVKDKLNKLITEHVMTHQTQLGRRGYDSTLLEQIHHEETSHVVED